GGGGAAAGRRAAGSRERGQFMAPSGSIGYTKNMLQYHAAFYLPRGTDRMVVAEVLDFPGVFSQGFDLPDARTMVASALEDMAESYLEEGRPLPTPSATATDPEADYIELIPLSVAAGATRPTLVRR
ncbi:MAG: type II toxin-antitoxin system HicB family antitoxin, partial [Acidobacteria bacterium]|nr:type II toxin-antitoxin system HicB family antitoxin [Acidobacteriota bacterium]